MRRNCCGRKTGLVPFGQAWMRRSWYWVEIRCRKFQIPSTLTRFIYKAITLTVQNYSSSLSLEASTHIEDFGPHDFEGGPWFADGGAKLDRRGTSQSEWQGDSDARPLGGHCARPGFTGRRTAY